MRAYVNELALAEACAAADPEHTPLVALLKGRYGHAVLESALFCARGMPNTPVREGLLLRGVAHRLTKDEQRLFFAWVDKKGPFFEVDGQSAERNFVFGDDKIDVTHLGLGEAARRLFAFQKACVLSPVEDTASRFAIDPLVVQRLQDEVSNHVEVPNFRDAATLAEAVQADEPDPTNWKEVLARARERFDRLLIGDHCDTVLSGQPMVPSQGRRVSELCAVLQTLMEEMDPGGQLSATGQELRRKHFVGETAWFSDESESNQQTPARYTFPDPAGGEPLICFWHGKIRAGVFRMHFEWPPADPAGRLRVVYIGRKL